MPPAVPRKHHDRARRALKFFEFTPPLLDLLSNPRVRRINRAADDHWLIVKWRQGVHYPIVRRNFAIFNVKKTTHPGPRDHEIGSLCLSFVYRLKLKRNVATTQVVCKTCLAACF